MKLLALIKKEFYRFFHDPRLVITILLPGIVIFILYSVLGNMINAEKTYDFKVYLSGGSMITEQIRAAVPEGSTLEFLTADSQEAAVEAVKSGDVTAYLSFSDDFDGTVFGGEVKFWFRGTDEASSAFYSIAASILQANGMRFSVVAENVESREDMGITVMANLLPFLVVTFVFSACMSVTLESVAGEKERGTLATILATSVKRSHLALGKILPLSCVAALGAASSFIGVVLSLPKMMNLSIGSIAASYGFLSYLLLFLLIISFVPLIVAAISAVSAYAKTVKEASGYTSVVMVLVMVLSLVSTFVTNIGEWSLAVPVLNAVLVMGRIFAGETVIWQSFVAIGVNLSVTALLVLLVSKMLSSERIMFGK